MDNTTDEKPATSILYVEDDDDTQKIVTEFLRSKFPRITLLLAKNGQEGLDIYAKNSPDIVVTDVRMPIIDGIQMAKKIKELDNDAQIIVLSAADEVTCILEAIDIGIHHYVLKPLKMEKLVATLERCLDRISQFKIRFTQTRSKWSDVFSKSRQND